MCAPLPAKVPTAGRADLGNGKTRGCGSGFACAEVPRGLFEGLAEQSDAGGREIDCGCTAAAPGSLAGSEDIVSGLHELLLLSGCEFDHGMLVVGIAEGREDTSLQPEIGVIHVGGLGGACDGQGESPEFGGSHFGMGSG